MTKLEVIALRDEMLGAAESVFKERWHFVRDFAVPEFEKIACSIVEIHTLTATEQIGEGEASVLLEMQKNAARGILMMREGTGLLIVEKSINAGLGMVKNSVNTALGFPLI